MPFWARQYYETPLHVLQIRTRAALLNEDTARNISYLWPGNQTTLKVPAPTRALKIDISQPLLNKVH
jgi:hypothetical protein